MLLAATPAWFADNVAQISVGAFVVFAVVVLRVVQKMALRITLLAVLAAMAVFVYANRAPLETCARTCECSIADRHVSVPICDPGLTQ